MQTAVIGRAPAVAHSRSPGAATAPAAATPWHWRRVPTACMAAAAAPSQAAASIASSRPQHCSSRQQQQRARLIQTQAGPVDAAPAWTLDQIAGLAFGGVMVAFYFSSNFVDEFIAKQQRKQLGLCERCGGLNEPATCSQEGCPMKFKAL